MRPPIILKLGGSVITDKSKWCTPDLIAIDKVAEQIAQFHGPLVLLHGGGSYAHPIVVKARLQSGFRGPVQLESISETELYLDQLTRILGVSLLLRNRAFVPISPMSFLTLTEGEISRYFLEPIRNSLGLGLIPLIHGDLVFDSEKGFGVVSADRLASFLGTRLNASRVLFGCDIDGVYSEDPKKFRKAELIREVNKNNHRQVVEKLSASRSRDATGGMLGKVKEAIRLARTGHESYIFNLRRERSLTDFLDGQQRHGTRFPSWK